MFVLSWIEQIWEKLSEIIQVVGTSLDTLVENIESVQFDEQNVIYQYIGMVRFVIGDVLYLPLSIMVSIGILLTLYRLIILIIDIIGNLIPGLKGKITIR